MDSNLTMEIFTLWSREMAMEILFLSRGKSPMHETLRACQRVGFMVATNSRYKR